MPQHPTSTPAVRDNDEPRAGDVTVPIWLILVCGALFYTCQLYLGNHVGGFDGQIYAPFDSPEELVAANPVNEADAAYLTGQDVYNKTCIACHQPNGMGKEGVAPPLAGSEWVLANTPDRITHIVLNGLSGPISVKGKEYNLAMPPWRDLFTDKQLAGVLTYIRDPRSFGNKASAVKPEQLAAARKDTHPGPETVPELLKIPVP